MIVEHDALRHHWYVVAETADLAPDGRPRPLSVTLLGSDYVVWRTTSGTLSAAPDRCPHREAPLSLGTIEDDCLVCAYHGWTFAADGRCISVPSSGDGRSVAPKAHLPVVHVAERYGLVWLCPGDPVGAIPTIAADDDPAFRRINSGIQRWHTSVTRMTDNFLDIAHFPWVHRGTFGIDATRVVPPIGLEQLDDDFFGYQYEVEVGNEAGASQSGIDSPTVTRRMTTGYHLPFTVRSTIHYETGLEHLILLCSTPIDAANSYFTFVIWRNDDFSVPADEAIAFDRAIGEEDRVMLERIPGELPLDLQSTASVQADRASVEWRRQLRALLETPRP